MATAAFQYKKLLAQLKLTSGGYAGARDIGMAEYKAELLDGAKLCVI